PVGRGLDGGRDLKQARRQVPGCADALRVRGGDGRGDRAVALDRIVAKLAEDLVVARAAGDVILAEAVVVGCLDRQRVVEVVDLPARQRLRRAVLVAVGRGGATPLDHPAEGVVNVRAAVEPRAGERGEGGVRGPREAVLERARVAEDRVVPRFAVDGAAGAPADEDVI